MTHDFKPQSELLDPYADVDTRAPLDPYAGTSGGGDALLDPYAAEPALLDPYAGTPSSGGGGLLDPYVPGAIASAGADALLDPYLDD